MHEPDGRLLLHRAEDVFDLTADWRLERRLGLRRQEPCLHIFHTYWQEVTVRSGVLVRLEHKMCG